MNKKIKLLALLILTSILYSCNKKDSISRSDYVENVSGEVDLLVGKWSKRSSPYMITTYQGDKTFKTYNKKELHTSGKWVRLEGQVYRHDFVDGFGDESCIHIVSKTNPTTPSEEYILIPKSGFYGELVDGKICNHFMRYGKTLSSDHGDYSVTWTRLDPDKK